MLPEREWDKAFEFLCGGVH